MRRRYRGYDGSSWVGPGGLLLGCFVGVSGAGREEATNMLDRIQNADNDLGLENTGIYRLSGTTSKVQALKRALDTGELDVHLTIDLGEPWDRF